MIRRDHALRFAALRFAALRFARDVRYSPGGGKLLWGSVALAVLIAVVGCGGEKEKPDGSAGSDPSTPPAAAAESAAGAPSPENTASTPPAPEKTAEEILADMVAAYRTAKTYGDTGWLNLHEAVPGESAPRAHLQTPYLVAFQRPNRIRIDVGDARIVCDGENLLASGHIQNQLLKKPAPETLAIEDIFSEPSVVEATVRDYTVAVSWVPIQALLLLSPEPLKTLVPPGADVSLLEPRSLAGRVCDRVLIEEPEAGRTVYWVERGTDALLRCELPLAPLGISPADRPRFRLFIDFVEASLNRPIDPKAFELSVPKTVRIVDHFEPTGFKTLGTTVDQFSIRDLDGATADLADFRGKTLAVVFWSTQTVESRRAVVDLARVAARYAGDDSVAFLAVNIDSPDRVKDEAVRNVVADWGVTVPVYRDPNTLEQFIQKLEGLAAPTTLLIDPGGVVQGYQISHHPDYIRYLAHSLEAIRAGVDQNAAIRKQFEREQKQFEQLLDNAVATRVYRALRPGEPAGNSIDATAEEPAPVAAADDPIRDLPVVMSTREVFSKANPGFDSESATPDLLFATPTKTLDAVLVHLEEDGYRLTAYGGGQERAAATIPVGKAIRDARRTDRLLYVKPAVAEGGATLVAFEDRGNVAYLLDDALNVVQKIERPGDAVLCDVSIVNLSGDGASEIVVADTAGVECLTMQQESRWHVDYPPPPAPVVVTPLAKPSGGADLLVRPGQDQALLIDQAGQQKASFLDGLNFAGMLGAVYRNPTLGDMTGDGLADLVYVEPLAGTQDHELLCLDATGRIQWRFRLPRRGDRLRAPTSIAQVDVLGRGAPQWSVVAAGTREVLLFDGSGAPLGRVAMPEDVTPMVVGRWNGVPAVFGTRNRGGEVVVLALESGAGEAPSRTAELSLGPETAAVDDLAPVAAPPAEETP